MGKFSLVRLVKVPFDRERIFPTWYLVLWIMLAVAAIVNLLLLVFGGADDPLALTLFFVAWAAWSVVGHYVGRERPLVQRMQKPS